MGHGYITVAGFGILLNIEEFIDVFSDGGIDLDEDYTEYLSDISEDIGTDHNIDIHYEKQNKAENIFICAAGSPSEDARSGGFQVLDIKKLEENITGLKEFAKSYFPDKLMMFSYQDN